jgi:hypothetical protein
MIHCEAQFDALSANLSNTSGQPEPDTSVVDQRVQLRIALQHLAAHSRQLDGFSHPDVQHRHCVGCQYSVKTSTEIENGPAKCRSLVIVSVEITNYRMGGVVMSSQGVIFKRCGCQDPADGRRLGRTCPQLAEAGAWELVFPCVGDKSDGSAGAGASVGPTSTWTTGN